MLSRDRLAQLRNYCLMVRDVVHPTTINEGRIKTPGNLMSILELEMILDELESSRYPTRT